MSDDLSFGWRTAVLLVATVQLLLIAAALTRPIENRAANRTLALLLVVLAGICTPWMIGFAGFYDRWQWLSFVPVAITLGVAPLFYLYVHALVRGRWPAQAWRHMVPALAQFGYLAACFLILRQPLKNEWLSQADFAYSLVTGLGIIAGMTGYGLASLKLLRDYRSALAERRSDDHRFAARWLSSAIIALFVLMLVWTGYLFWDLVSPLGYRGLMGLYVAIAAIALFLGIEGWRHASAPFPEIAALDEAENARDWRALGEQWAEETRRQGWYLEPELSIAGLARRLGTNTGYLSRALNEGLGLNFSTFINRLRSEAVARAIGEGSGADLLAIALASGFSSKASFNRAFRARYGVSPSAYRRQRGSIPEFAPNFGN